ncbi:polyadenylate-binding protein-interacting protein 5 [Quercus suber]|uniref:Polyadenylate-binding protein-interacting protein 5 n=1 Tax=Quercus suber TaxID=58331 RepID=A0AAW0L607_QUESU
MKELEKNLRLEFCRRHRLLLEPLPSLPGFNLSRTKKKLLPLIQHLAVTFWLDAQVPTIHFSSISFNQRKLPKIILLQKISLESRYFSLESRNFLLEILSTSIGLRFSGFGGGKPKPTRRSQFLVVKARHRVVESADIKSNPVSFFGWVGSSDGFGQPYSLPFFFSKSKEYLPESYAASYIPLSKRNANGRTFETAKTLGAAMSLPSHHAYGYGSSPQNVNQAADKQMLDEFDIDLEYLQMSFPGISDQSLTDVYAANRGDLEATVDMLNQLECYTVESSESLPDTLDIGDVSEFGSSADCASLKLKTVEGKASAASSSS